MIRFLHQVMLSTIYQSYLEEIQDGELIKYKRTQPPDGVKFKINYYSQIGIYTLVGWELSAGGEAITGEYLYRDITPVAGDGGQLPLYVQEPSGPTQVPQFFPSVWDKIHSHVGKHGVPNYIAKELRNNIIIFTQ